MTATPLDREIEAMAFASGDRGDVSNAQYINGLQAALTVMIVNHGRSRAGSAIAAAVIAEELQRRVDELAATQYPADSPAGHA